jgi:hypothetical protein
MCSIRFNKLKYIMINRSIGRYEYRQYGLFCLSFYLYEYMGLLPVIDVVRIANHFIYMSTWVYSRLLVWSVLLIILFIRVHGFTPGYWCGPYC